MANSHDGGDDGVDPILDAAEAATVAARDAETAARSAAATALAAKEALAAADQVAIRASKATASAADAAAMTRAEIAASAAAAIEAEAVARAVEVAASAETAMETVAAERRDESDVGGATAWPPRSLPRLRMTWSSRHEPPLTRPPQSRQRSPPRPRMQRAPQPRLRQRWIQRLGMRRSLVASLPAGPPPPRQHRMSLSGQPGTWSRQPPAYGWSRLRGSTSPSARPSLPLNCTGPSDAGSWRCTTNRCIGWTPVLW